MVSLDSRGDPDRVFSYYTKQQVTFLDRYLGITFYAMAFLIGAYILGYIFIYDKGYLEYEHAKGAVATHVYGDATGISSGKKATRFFSSEEITYPGLENGNVFVATRQIIHRQMRGMCEDAYMPCMMDSDCSTGGGGYCSKNGLCMENSWCDQEEVPEDYEISTNNLQIWARSSIQFLKLNAERVYSTESEAPVPQPGYNTFTVDDLLMKCEPLPVRYEEVAELGAAIEVQFRWECAVMSKEACKPEVHVRRLDTVFDPDNIGFGFSYPEYIDDDHRLRNEVRGVRIFFKTSGRGRKVSIAASITKATMGASLFALANILADMLMTKVFALQKKYIARKYENSPDFSEYIGSLDTRKVTYEHLSEVERQVKAKEDLWMAKLNEEDV
jgi:hypothetical protein